MNKTQKSYNNATTGLAIPSILFQVCEEQFQRDVKKNNLKSIIVQKITNNACTQQLYKLLYTYTV